MDHGTVIGQDVHYVPVKHGSIYVRVHPCRVLLEKMKKDVYEYSNQYERSHDRKIVVSLQSTDASEESERENIGQ